MREELLSCPFCGGRALTPYPNVSTGAWWISCSACPAEIEEGSKERAIAAWNARAKPPHPADDNHKALVEALLAADHAITGIELARIRGADDGREGVRLAKLVVNLKAATQNLAAAFQSRQEEK